MSIQKGTVVALAKPAPPKHCLHKTNIISKAVGLPASVKHLPEPDITLGHNLQDPEASSNGKSSDHIIINKDTILSAKAQDKLKAILLERRRAFVGPDGPIGRCNLYEAKIQLKEGSVPFRK